jgi:hypothetical protein
MSQEPMPCFFVDPLFSPLILMVSANSQATLQSKAAWLKYTTRSLHQPSAMQRIRAFHHHAPLRRLATNPGERSKLVLARFPYLAVTKSLLLFLGTK